MHKSLLAFIFLLFTAVTHAQLVTTIAGDGTSSYGSDNVPAVSSSFSFGPLYIAVDDSGNVYIPDQNRVRMVNKAGIITTIAGTGYTSPTTLFGGFSGDGGPATAAELSWAQGIALDAKHNIYIAEAANNRIRKINTAGIISTFAGRDSMGYQGDGGPATAARLHYPTGLAFDNSGNLLVTDGLNHVVRRIDTSGTITTIVGNGYGAGTINGGFGGDGGAATAASLNQPEGIFVDKAGNILIADAGNNSIRKVTPDGIITTIAGFDTTAGYNGDSIPATMARLCAPSGIAADTAGNIYIADAGNCLLRVINSHGIISIFAGIYGCGFNGDGQFPLETEFFSPEAIAFDKHGNTYIADAANYRVRFFAASPSGIKPVTAKPAISLSPNPCSGSFTLTLPANMLPADITVFDAHGAIVSHSSTTTAATQYHISSAAGLYLVRVMANGMLWTEKIVVL